MEPAQHPHTLIKYRVRVLGHGEEPDIGELRPQKQTSGAYCEWEGWRHGNMCLSDRS